jgi:hypothetical protein
VEEHRCRCSDKELVSFSGQQRTECERAWGAREEGKGAAGLGMG